MKDPTWYVNVLPDHEIEKMILLNNLAYKILISHKIEIRVINKNKLYLIFALSYDDIGYCVSLAYPLSQAI